MKGKRIKTLGVAMAATVLVTVGSGTAFASGDVTWQNAWSGGYLYENYCAGCSDGIFLSTGPFEDSSVDHWTDTQYSDGGWTEVNDRSGNCLDSNFNGNVYQHGCLSGDVYQEWYEISTSTGWALEDDETGRFLDTADGNTVYTNATNYGNSDAHQRWH